MASNVSVFPNSEASVSPVVIPEPVLSAASLIPSTSTATAEETNSNQSTSTSNERAQKSTVNSHSSRMTTSDFEQRYDDIWCHGRAERMVRVNLPPEGRPYARADFVPHLEKTVGLQAVEAIGPTQRSQVWEITFATKTVKQWFLDAGDFRIKNDFTASVHSSTIRRHYVKVLWYADCKRIADITEFIEKRGYKVMNARRGLSIIEGLTHARTNEVLLTVEGDSLAGLPYTYEYTVNGERRMSLISVPGRPPLCLKCGFTGHIRSKCDAKFCRRCRQWGHSDDSCALHYAAAAARGTANQATDGGRSMVDVADGEDAAIQQGAMEQDGAGAETSVTETAETTAKQVEQDIVQQAVIEADTAVQAFHNLPSTQDWAAASFSEDTPASTLTVPPTTEQPLPQPLQEVELGSEVQENVADNSSTDCEYDQTDITQNMDVDGTNLSRKRFHESTQSLTAGEGAASPVVADQPPATPRKPEVGGTSTKSDGKKPVKKKLTSLSQSQSKPTVSTRHVLVPPVPTRQSSYGPDSKGGGGRKTGPSSAAGNQRLK